MSVFLFCAKHISCLLFPQPTCTDQGYILKKSAKYYVWLFSAVKTWSALMDFRQGVLCCGVWHEDRCWIVWVVAQMGFILVPIHPSGPKDVWMLGSIP